MSYKPKYRSLTQYVSMLARFLKLLRMEGQMQLQIGE